MPGSVSHISRKDRHHSTHIKSAMEECWPNDYCLHHHESNKRDEYDSEARQLTADPSVQTLSLFILPPDTPCPPFIIHSPFTPSHTSIPPFAHHTTLSIITIITQSRPLLTSSAWDSLKPPPSSASIFSMLLSWSNSDCAFAPSALIHCCHDSSGRSG